MQIEFMLSTIQG